MHMQNLDDPEIGTTVRSLREQRGWSQQALAAKANVSVRTLARIEAGEDMRVGTMLRLAYALGAAPHDLLTTEAAS